MLDEEAGCCSSTTRFFRRERGSLRRGRKVKFLLEEDALRLRRGKVILEGGKLFPSEGSCWSSKRGRFPLGDNRGGLFLNSGGFTGECPRADRISCPRRGVN